MSQEQPKPPEPQQQTPIAPKPTTPKSESGFEKVLQTLVQTWKQLEPNAKIQNIWTRLRPVLINIPVWWKATLTKIRTLLPQSVNQKLSNDTLLTGAIAAFFIFLFWVSSILSPGKPPQIAEVPPLSSTAPEEVIVPGEVTAPPELTAPSSPESVAIIPPPPPVLTPEQKLIAAIQNQVAQITSQYADGLIQAIQANFPSSILTVKVSEDWYTFDSSKQDNLATDMWRRAKELDFSKLEISDSQGSLVARSPVVGSNMVILKRK